MFQLGARYTDQRRAQVSETTYQLNVDRVTDEVNTLIKLHRNLAAQYQADQAVLGRSAYQKVFGDFLSGHHRSIESLTALLTKLNLERQADKVSVDRKSTRLNSSHVAISYAVFCLTKKTSMICATLAV